MMTVTQPDLSLSNSLSDLAARIRAEHEACGAALKRGIEHARAAGKMLIEAKGRLKHGEWLPWLRDHCQIPERTARRYMEIAPYAADEIGQLADLTIRQLPFPTDGTWEEISVWVRSQLDGPFTDYDFGDLDFRWIDIKLLHQVDMPALVSVLLSSIYDGRQQRLPLLRLCGFDDLVAAAQAIAPVAAGQCGLKIDRNTIKGILDAAGVIQIEAMRFLGAILIEIDHRDQRGYTEQQYQREWRETHTAWMALLHDRREALAADQIEYDERSLIG